jgi:beta-glucosidase/6-phospho-beta-glucosidase/beta-galactosidase
MQICEQTTEQIEQTVERWVEESTTRLEQACRSWTEQTERWVEDWQTRCVEQTSQVCSWAPWPLNTLCSWITQTVCGLVSVLVRVVETIVRTVCETVTTIIKVLKRVIATISVPVIKMICRFAQPAEARIEDTVGDLSGANFDRRDDQGNLIPFIWGAATSAYQVEGGIDRNDWHHFLTSPTIKRRVERVGSLGGTKLRIEDAGRADDHWNADVLAEDLDRAKLLGLNAYRFSLEWSRIQPDKPAWVDQPIELHQQAVEERSTAERLRREAALADLEGDKRESDRKSEEAEFHEERANSLDAEAEAKGAGPAEADDFDPEALNRYRAVVTMLKERGLQPILTLSHLSLPDWVCFPPIAHELNHLSGSDADSRFLASLRGWENPATVNAFVKFVEFVVPFFKDDVRYWVTLNEPIGSTMAAGYMAGIWPPGFFNKPDKAKKVYFNLIEAHVRAYDKVKQVAGEEAQVGFSHAMVYPRPARGGFLDFGSNLAARNQWHFAMNTYYLDAVVKGEVNREIWRKDTPTINEDWVGRLDFIAPQYYRAMDIYHDALIAIAAPWLGGNGVVDLRGTTDEDLQRYLINDMGWTIYPGGLYRLLNELYGSYGLPILITENGMPEQLDRNRCAYTIAHLEQVLRAIKDGIPVIGYIHWSLVDNWELAYGYSPEAHFGLFTVDRGADLDTTDAPSFPRHVTEGALALQYVIANSGRVATAETGENPMAEPVSRFGTISPDGLETKPPERIAGNVWEGRFTRGPRAESEFSLYLSRLPHEQWIGMIFLVETHRWLRLEDIAARFSEDAATFSFHHPAGDVVLQYEAKFTRGTSRASGFATAGEDVWEWEAELVANAGLFKSAGGYTPSHIGFRRLEGTYDEWRAKFFASRPIWGPVESVDWNGTAVELELDDYGVFRGTLAGTKLSGTVALFGGGGTATIDWEGERLPDDIPF